MSKFDIRNSNCNYLEVTTFTTFGDGLAPDWLASTYLTFCCCCPCGT